MHCNFKAIPNEVGVIIVVGIPQNMLISIVRRHDRLCNCWLPRESAPRLRNSHRRKVVLIIIHYFSRIFSHKFATGQWRHWAVGDVESWEIQIQWERNNVWRRGIFWDGSSCYCERRLLPSRVWGGIFISSNGYCALYLRAQKGKGDHATYAMVSCELPRDITLISWWISGRVSRGVRFYWYWI